MPAGKAMRVVTVTPTNDERLNVGRLADELEEAFDCIDGAQYMLIVGDDLPGGTVQVVRQAIATLLNVHLATRTRQGIGFACVRGLRPRSRPAGRRHHDPNEGGYLSQPSRYTVAGRGAGRALLRHALLVHPGQPAAPPLPARNASPVAPQRAEVLVATSLAGCVNRSGFS
jgi:hypothetical protein